MSSGQDQAAGLRKWANLQRQQQAQPDDDSETDSPLPESAEVVSPAPTDLPEPESEPEPKKILMVVGLPGTGSTQANRVRERLEQWSALGRQWAGQPENWDIHIVAPDDPSLHDYARKHSRWALWVNSHADSFANTFRILHQLQEAGGPKRLLALHEPHLSRAGLLSNLQAAARNYLEIELLILAR